MSDTKRPVLLLSQEDIAALLGVKAATVRWYRAHYGKDSDHPFPEADYVTGAGGRPVPGWLPGREEELREWHASRQGQGVGGGRPPGSRLGGHVLESAKGREV